MRSQSHRHLSLLANFGFSRMNALEDYSLERMEAEIHEASASIERLVGLRPDSFAYPCRQSFRAGARAEPATSR